MFVYIFSVFIIIFKSLEVILTFSNISDYEHKQF